jgi:hypothetical protein
MSSSTITELYRAINLIASAPPLQRKAHSRDKIENSLTRLFTALIEEVSPPASVEATNGLQILPLGIGIGGPLTESATSVNGVAGQSLEFIIQKAGIPPVASTAAIQLTETNVAFSALIDASGNGGYCTVTESGTWLGQSNNSNLTNINIGNSGGILFDDSVANFGAYYGADYSTVGALNPRWIPDKAWVESQIPGGANGLQVVGSNLELGSAITKNTTLSRTFVDFFGGEDVDQTIQWSNGLLQIFVTSNVTNNRFGYVMADPEVGDLYFGYIEGATGDRQGFNFGKFTKLQVVDQVDSKGPVGLADYSTNALADDLAYPQVVAVKALLKRTEVLTFSWDSIAEGASVGFLNVISVDSFTSARAAGKAIPSTAVIKNITVNLQGSSSAAAAGNVTIQLQRREPGNAAVYTAGSGTNVASADYTIGGVLAALQDRVERTTGIDTAVGGTTPVLHAYVSAIGFATLSSLIVDVEIEY